MIVNATTRMHVIVELTKEDIQRVLKGEKIYMSSRAYNDEAVLAEVYCSNPGQVDDDI